MRRFTILLTTLLSTGVCVADGMLVTDLNTALKGVATRQLESLRHPPVSNCGFDLYLFNQAVMQGRFSLKSIGTSEREATHLSMECWRQEARSALTELREPMNDKCIDDLVLLKSPLEHPNLLLESVGTSRKEIHEMIDACYAVRKANQERFVGDIARAARR
jgi:hypothetical protein